jgi:hypothetical protein
MTSESDLYDRLACYSLSHTDPSFLHQHVVDPYVAQHANEHTEPIGIVFALIGLYLLIERNFTGRQVQRIHTQLAKQCKQWPPLAFPRERGTITVAAVLATSPGRERNAMIRNWCLSVWEAWKESHNQIRSLVKTEMDIN